MIRGSRGFRDAMERNFLRVIRASDLDPNATTWAVVVVVSIFE